MAQPPRKKIGPYAYGSNGPERALTEFLGVTKSSPRSCRDFIIIIIIIILLAQTNSAEL